ncbi:unnamed protein product [Rhizophagus irregularis]|nr:unnamed protein product [Rhizophagus irregularis]CAB4489508.1 unnamed protein product [Rhizophagus irregularis]CAB5183121.1 unnamed protein product [Rhizophagus irregularis]
MSAPTLPLAPFTVNRVLAQRHRSLHVKKRFPNFTLGFACSILLRKPKYKPQANFLPFFYENLQSFRFFLSVRLQNYASTIYHARSSTFPSTN